MLKTINLNYNHQKGLLSYIKFVNNSKEERLFEINEILFKLNKSILNLSFMIYDLIYWKKDSNIMLIELVPTEAVMADI